MRRVPASRRAFQERGETIIISISLYRDSIADLDRKVKELKAKGFTMANRSWLIRAALRQVDLDLALRSASVASSKGDASSDP